MEFRPWSPRFYCVREPKPCHKLALSLSWVFYLSMLSQYQLGIGASLFTGFSSNGIDFLVRKFCQHFPNCVKSSQWMGFWWKFNITEDKMRLPGLILVHIWLH